MSVTVTQFKGLRNDMGQKFTPPDYFYVAQNVNYDDLVGANKILFPFSVMDLSNTNDVDGVFEFNYLDANNQSKTEQIAVVGGTIYKNWVSSTPVVVGSDLSTGKCTFGVSQNKLLIANGRNYPKFYDGRIVYEMGAPAATVSAMAGNPNGTYYYEMTYVTAGGEERIGTKSNTVTASSFKIDLEIPIGYAGTLTRKIYRTISGGDAPKLVATIADNTTRTYTDDTADGSLGADIISINNECPRPYFIEVQNGKLVGAVISLYPTNIYVSDTNIEVWDVNVFEDVSSQGGDNTPIVGIAQNYSFIIAGSAKNIYVVDVSGALPDVSSSRANVGVKNGYTMKNVPMEGDFPGGVLFVSTLNDVRLFNGNFKQQVPTSLDNLQADNWAQPIRGTIARDFATGVNLYAQFYSYKYHLIAGQGMYVFDIRTRGWSTYMISTESFSPTYNVFGSVGEKLYIGQKGASVIEEMYSSTKYKGEEYQSIIQTQQVLADSEVKYIPEIEFYFCTPYQAELEIEVVLDGDRKNLISQTFTLAGGSFLSPDFDSDDFDTVTNVEDYRTMHINQWARWISIQIKSTAGMFLFRGYKVIDEKDLVKSE